MYVVCAVASELLPVDYREQIQVLYGFGDCENIEVVLW